MSTTPSAHAHQPVAIPALTSGDQQRQQLVLQALTTEHFGLQAARSATISDTNGRASLFMASVSSGVVVLALVGQLATAEAFYRFALAVLPTLLLLGLLTYVRLNQSAAEDLQYAGAINRIRRYYVGLDPDAGQYLALSAAADLDGVLHNQGLSHTRWHMLSHAAVMIFVVEGALAGAVAALAFRSLHLASIGVATVIGIAAAAAVIGLFAAHQRRYWRRAMVRDRSHLGSS